MLYRPFYSPAQSELNARVCQPVNARTTPSKALLNPLQSSPRFDLGAWSATQLDAIEKALSAWVACPVQAPAPAGLGDAMRYAVLDGGKRLRPLLVLAACEAVSGDIRSAMRPACAVELIHAYSLVHDDMPCMDDDVLRRGKPTVHVKFGEAQALLAGDALQALAFEILTPTDGSMNHTVQAALCRMLAQAAGFQGMAGGQAIDLASVGLPLDTEQLHHMHRLKTGALLQASVMMGARCAAEPLPPGVNQALQDYGAAVGLAFQVVDDILDVTADSATLGKTAGKDAAQEKPTFVSLMGLEASRNHAQQLLRRALASLETIEHTGMTQTHALRALANMLVNRQH
ncbi:MAG: farnesyl-diphosphate synthase [Polaromonas sp.]|nr:farnesyl-diphosphate synthase [Polaromonas sp.]